MSMYDETISKIRRLPEPLVEVNNFVTFLSLKSDTTRAALETSELAYYFQSYKCRIRRLNRS